MSRKNKTIAIIGLGWSGSGALIDFEISPSGTGTGSKKYTGEGIVTSKSLNNTTDGLVEATFALQVSGGVTEGAH